MWCVRIVFPWVFHHFVKKFLHFFREGNSEMEWQSFRPGSYEGSVRIGLQDVTFGFIYQWTI